MAAASIITSVVTGGTNNHSTVSSEANTYATDFVSQGVLGSITNTNGVAPTTGSFGVNADASPDMGVTIKGSGNTGSGAAIAYVTVTPTSQDKQVLRARMTSDYTAYTINANSTGSTVYDWIYLQASATNAATPSAAADNVITLVTSRSTSNTTDNGTPPTYGTLLAIVTVANGASSITNANITDMRTQAALSAQTSGSAGGWTALGYPLTYSANNGNKEFQATASVDLTGILTPGMRLKVTRAVTPPTQSMSFTAASSQYATKASPAGITFTGAFTCEAWVYLNSYTGQNQFMLARQTNGGTSGGWGFRVNSNGQVEIYYGSGSSFTVFQSYQSLPLKRWIHVAGVVTSVSGKTGSIYLNGLLVSSTASSSAATTLTQEAVDLRVGAASASPTNSYFDGYMSEVRLWSTNQTSANIQANMTKNLVGNESNLIALYQGSGNFNDATSNANNLTANGGAIATQAANPYNAIEYAIVTAVSYSNPTTTVTLFTGTAGTLPNMTLNNPYYSTAKIPFGFPGSRRTWRVLSLYRVTTTQSSPTNGTWYNLNSQQLSIPTGDWITKYSGTLYVVNATNPNSGFSTLSTANNTESDTDFTVRPAYGATGATGVIGNAYRDKGITNASATPYYLNVKVDDASATSINWGPSGEATIIEAECAYA